MSLHCLGKHSPSLAQGIRMVFDLRLAQQFGKPYPRCIGHRVFSFSLVSATREEPHDDRLRQRRSLLHMSRDMIIHEGTLYSL